MMSGFGHVIFFVHITMKIKCVLIFFYLYLNCMSRTKPINGPLYKYSLIVSTLSDSVMFGQKNAALYSESALKLQNISYRCDYT